MALMLLPTAAPEAAGDHPQGTILTVVVARRESSSLATEILKSWLLSFNSHFHFYYLGILISLYYLSKKLRLKC